MNSTPPQPNANNPLQANNTNLFEAMEAASQALVAMDYLGSEAICLVALKQARQEKDWDSYARILMPLQEARRQRRMIAADAELYFGSSEPISSLDRLTGCIVATQPMTREQVHQLDQQARQANGFVEWLWADNSIDASTWTIRSFTGPDVSCQVPAPPRAWLDCWTAGNSEINQLTAAHWFIEASEKLGDAALEQVTAPAGSIERLEQLEAMLDVVTDHEILHQRLGDAARDLLRNAN